MDKLTSEEIDALSTFYYSTDIPLTLIDQMGNTSFTLGGPPTFCSVFKDYTEDNCPCTQCHLLASKQAVKLGEAYIFSCDTGLINFTVPLFEYGIFRGAVIAGPFLMDFPDMIMVDDIILKFNLTMNCRSKLFSGLKSLQIIEPSRVTAFSKLLFIVVSSILGKEKEVLLTNNIKYNQQIKISESIHSIKNEESSSLYPYEVEKELLIRVKGGDIKGAKSLLNDLIGHIFFSSGGDMTTIKARTIELCTLLSRASVEGGADEKLTFEMNSKFINELNFINSLEDLSFWLITVLDKFTDNVLNLYNVKNLSIIQKAISYINEHYMEQITLDKIASYVHLNPSYFSSLFKKEVGSSYSSYLNKIRIDQSMILIKNTNLSILEIALNVGFDDQSYFTKVFKNFANMTPKEFKQRML